MPINRAIGKAVIEKLAVTEASANEIIRIAQQMGGGYARAQMLEDIRVAGQRFKNQYWVEKIETNEVIPKGLFVEKDLGADAKYRVYGTYSYYDEGTDDYYETTKSFYTDDLANKGSWQDDWERTFQEKYSAEGKEFIGFNITAVEHNIDYAY